MHEFENVVISQKLDYYQNSPQASLSKTRNNIAQYIILYHPIHSVWNLQISTDHSGLTKYYKNKIVLKSSTIMGLNYRT